MRKLILGSDWWTDCDDAVAMRLLCNAHQQGKIRLLGVVLNACMEHSLRSADAFLRYSGVTVPVGLDPMAPGEVEHRFQKRLTVELDSPFRDNREAEDPVRLCRRLLASEGPAELAEIGFPQVLVALLNSGPDEFSPLTGLELVRAKVPRLWIMAGKWDEQGAKEHNFSLTGRIAENASELCRRFPSPITFLGWEVGYSVLTGGALPETDSLKKILNDHGSARGRCSWDPMLADLAVTGDPAEAGYRTVRGWAEVDPSDGRNRFREDPEGPHEYVVKLQPDEWYADRINRQIGRRQSFS